jgi:hypothetical protein
MPLTPVELGELRRKTQAISDRLRALRDLVVDVYGEDSRVGEAIVRAVENMKQLQQTLARHLEAQVLAPPLPPSQQGSGVIAQAVEFTALSYLLDSAADAGNEDDAPDTDKDDDDA